MAFFSYLPNVYVGEGIKDDEDFKYRLVKNIFRRAKTRADLDQYVTLLEAYEVGEDESPANVALAFFNDPFLDWMILMVNNITDVYEQWPKNINDLQEYTRRKYNNPDAVHHYETVRAEFNGETFLEQGIQVNDTWRTVLPDGTTLGEAQSIYPVTNYEYEDYLNEQKRIIKLPTPPVIELILAEFEDVIAYEPHSELDQKGNKKSSLNMSSRFLNTAGISAASKSRDEGIGYVTSYDNGPGSATVQVGAAQTTTETTAPVTSVTPDAGTSNTTVAGTATATEVINNFNYNFF